MTKQEERNKRFDEKFLTYKSWSTSEKGVSAKVSPEELKAHLNSEVETAEKNAIAEERKRIVEMIAEKSYMNEYGDTVIDDVDDLLALINKDN